MRKRQYGHGQAECGRLSISTVGEALAECGVSVGDRAACRARPRSR